MRIFISSYKNLSAAPQSAAYTPEGQFKWMNGHLVLKIPETNLRNADNLKDGHVYQPGEVISVAATSAEDFKHWRNTLANLTASAEEVRDRFKELLHAGLTGVFGPDTSAKLAKDFVELQPLADKVPDLHFKHKYARLRQAFEFAAGTGAVLIQ